jgi:chemotaxis protein methyltransferase CheR
MSGLSAPFDPVELAHLVRIIARRLGLQLRQQEHHKLALVLQERLRVCRCVHLEQYCALLEMVSTSESQREWQVLAQVLTTGESYFLRDRGQTELLRRHLLPEIVARRRSQRVLRLWSAGCSTGEEPYSLAMLLQDVVPDLAQWDVRIWGTDVNPAAIEQARRGVFRAWSFRAVAAEVRDRHFQLRGSQWEIDPSIRNLVTFQVGNLVWDDPTMQGWDDLDLIVCRNVFVYFEATAIAQVLQHFYRALRPMGYLLTGHAELYGQDVSHLTALSFPDSVVYQRPAQSPQGMPKANGYPPTLPSAPPTSSSPTSSSPTSLLPTSSPTHGGPDPSALGGLPVTGGRARAIGTPPTSAGISAQSNRPSLNRSHSGSAQGSNARPASATVPYRSPSGSNLATPRPSNRSPNASNAGARTSAATSPTCPDPLAQLLTQAQALLHQRDRPAALHLATQAVAQFPQAIAAHILLAQLQADLGNYPAAAAAAQQALKLDATAIAPCYVLAHIAEEQGDIEQSKHWLKRVVYLDPQDLTAYLDLSELYLSGGDTHRASKMLSTARNLLRTQTHTLDAAHVDWARDRLSHLETALEKNH